MEVTKLFLFIQILVLSTPIQSTNYVKSNNSSLHNCPGSCLTLDEFIDDSTRYFTTGSTFVFLPGNHSQQNALNISNISGMIWRGSDSRSNNMIILSSGSLQCYNVTNFTIEGLNFIGSTNVTIFVFIRSAILLSSLVFQSNTGNMAMTRRAVQLKRSNITIINTFFEGIRGGAVKATHHSTLTLIDTAFIGNEVPKSSGGAIYCAYSTINMTGNNSIYNNRAYWRGGAIYCKNSTISMTGNNFLNNNRAYWKGGAIYCRYSTLTMTGNNSINNNRATRWRGGAIYCRYSTITMTGNNSINNNHANSSGGAIYCYNSTITMTGNNSINNNRATRWRGGAIYCRYSTITMTGNNSINNNLAKLSGGAIYCRYSTMTMTGNNSINNNHANSSGGAIYCNNSIMTMTGSNSINNNRATRRRGGAIYCQNSTISMTGSNFINNNCAKSIGGAIYCRYSTISMTWNNSINNNLAKLSGGAIYCRYSTMTMTGNNSINNNHANSSGGAIYCNNSIMTMTGNNFLNNNHATRRRGGAIYCYNSTMTMTGSNFINNNRVTRRRGGAIYCRYSIISMTGHNSINNNRANSSGGAIYCRYSIISMTGHNSINNNRANSSGGAIYCYNSTMTMTGNNFLNNNHATRGGGAVRIWRGLLMITGIANFSHNEASTGGALCLSESHALINGTDTNFIKNNGENSTVTFNGSINYSNHQGGIVSRNSSIEFYNNSALTIGGAISSEGGTLSFRGSISFFSNKAQIDGGALYAFKTEVAFYGTANFSSNAAQSGGAMYFTSGATLFLASILNVSHNNATDYGGAIFHKDIVTPIQCKEKISEEDNCFLQFDSRTQQARIESYENSAGKGGNFLYGGLLDMCYLEGDYEIENSSYDYLMNEGYIRIVSQDNTSSNKEIESKPLRLCFCYNNSFNYDIDCNMKSIEIQRGQELNVSLVAIGQGQSILSTNITALGENIRLKHNQTFQNTSRQCSSLQYSLYSNSDHGELELYPNGPCRDTGLAKAIVKVTFLPCPNGFRQSDEECVCDKRLEKYGAQCIIGQENNFIKRKETDTFWMSLLKSANDSYLGLILYHSCPVEYCTSNTVDIPLDNLDTQCASHRTGVLCGQCSDDYSLKLGSSRCAQCSNHYLGLLIPFALAGIVLITFLSVFRLTVAYGIINSLILYANIVQVNRRLFFPTDSINVLTVFIAWLNLDLGIETCFFNGLDAYIQTWLKFVFPFYIWILISLIILTSRYSMTVSKLIGTNPIAVLATLLLMSYSRILQVIIDVYTFARLDYPDGKKFAWWKDGNVPYLCPKHLSLVIFTSLVIIFFFLPYTFLLLLGPCLYRIPEGKCSRWLNRIKPLLDSYYAPYKKNTRYWTGFLLLIRCALYIAVTFSKSCVAAITITFSGILLTTWITGKIYNKTYISLIEGSIYMNLILSSVLSLTPAKGTGLVYTVGIVFVTMIGIILYQFHHLYFRKVTGPMMEKISHIIFIKRKEIVNDDIISSITSSQNVSETVIELREPLLEN